MKKSMKKKYTPYTDIGKVKPISSPPPADPGKTNQRLPLNKPKRLNKYSIGAEWNCSGARWPVYKKRILSAASNERRHIALIKELSGKMSYIPAKYLKKIKKFN